MSFRVINYKDNGLHKSITKDLNGNIVSCIYYKRKDVDDVLTKKVVEETMVNSYNGSDLTKVTITRKHYKGLPEALGDTEIEIINYSQA